ncbi:MAG TPA: class II aldolase/adducin family protein, partial [Clostridia bacterium]|nr:class II aldolase/adducin family protein [Clostridia bacterium]
NIHMKTLRQSMVEYATKFRASGFASDDTCFAVRLDEQTFMLSPLFKDREVTAEDISIIVTDDFDNAASLKDKAIFFYDLFLKRKDIWTAGIFKSKYAFELCQKGKTIPPILDDMCQILATRIETVDKLDITQVLSALKGENACQVRDYGMIVGERSLDELYTAANVLEKTAHCYIKAKQIGGGKHIPKFLAWAEHKVFKSVYSVQNQKSQRVLEGINDFSETQKYIYSKSKDKEDNIDERVAVLNIIKRMSENDFVQGTWGNVSLRLDGNTILCTPKGIGYNVLRPQDMVIVDAGSGESKGNIAATSEKGIHAGIQLNNPNYNAVLHAHPTYISIFAAAHQDLVIENEDDKKLLGDIVKVSSYASPSTKWLTKQTLLAFGNGRAAFMANHGVIVAGEDLETAYNALERLEEICKSKIEE